MNCGRWYKFHKWYWQMTTTTTHCLVLAPISYKALNIMPNDDNNNYNNVLIIYKEEYKKKGWGWRQRIIFTLCFRKNTTTTTKKQFGIEVHFDNGNSSSVISIIDLNLSWEIVCGAKKVPWHKDTLSALSSGHNYTSILFYSILAIGNYFDFWRQFCFYLLITNWLFETNALVSQ